MYIQVYTDGACINNGKKNSKAGVGIFIPSFGDNGLKISQLVPEYLNHTNNIAELYAIKLSLEILKKEYSDYEIHIYTDSQYSINVITSKWRAKQNIELINDIHKLSKLFLHVRYIYVEAHKNNTSNINHTYNNEADYLAKKAIDDYLKKK